MFSWLSAFMAVFLPACSLPSLHDVGYLADMLALPEVAEGKLEEGVTVRHLALEWGG